MTSTTFEFIIENGQDLVASLGADEGRQSDEDFLIFRSRDDSPASTIPFLASKCAVFVVKIHDAAAPEHRWVCFRKPTSDG